MSGLPPERAEATLTYYFKNGRVVTERTAFRLVDEDGRLKISQLDGVSRVEPGRGPVAAATAGVASASMRVAVLSDTHSPRFWKGCPPAVAAHLRRVPT